MNTPSHWLITAAVDKRLRGVQIVHGAFLLGSIAPDIPLYLLTLAGWIHLHLIRGWSTVSALRYMFDIQFFRDPLWVIGHNTLHSPTLLLLALVGVWRLQRRFPSISAWGIWFLIGCLLHTAVDIPVHVDDGPLLFFPMDWGSRFRSAISYWDPRYFGAQFFWFELGLDLVLSAYLWGPRLARWLGLRRRWEWD